MTERTMSRPLSAQDGDSEMKRGWDAVRDLASPPHGALAGGEEAGDDLTSKIRARVARGESVAAVAKDYGLRLFEVAAMLERKRR